MKPNIQFVFLFMIKCVYPNTLQKPNILLIVSDDLGFGDVSWNNPSIHTPRLEELLNEGIRLDNYYVQYLCTPSRSQLLSGRYQIHTGMQHNALRSRTKSGLPLEFPTLAQKLKEQGYRNHIVGKWHLGYHMPKYTPTYRGFDTFTGIYNGLADHYTHQVCMGGLCAYDFHRDTGQNLRVSWNNTDYSTLLYRDETRRKILEHNEEEPLFMFVSLQAVHAPIKVPEHYRDLYPEEYGTEQERTYAGMITCMDEAVGDIVDTFKEKGLWENTILIFSTDNGASKEDGGSNGALRGRRNTLWEGGIKGVGLISSPLLPMNKIGTKNNQLIHITDWYPTILHLAGASTAKMNLDGFDIWPSLLQNIEGPRTEILHNIDPLAAPRGTKSLHPHLFDTRIMAAIRVGPWKLLTGEPELPASMGSVNAPKEHDSPAEKNVWLFNIHYDPLEQNDLAESFQYDHVLRFLLARLQFYNSSAVRPINYLELEDLDYDPSRDTDGAWMPWL